MEFKGTKIIHDLKKEKQNSLYLWQVSLGSLPLIVEHLGLKVTLLIMECLHQMFSVSLPNP